MGHFNTPLNHSSWRSLKKEEKKKNVPCHVYILPDEHNHPRRRKRESAPQDLRLGPFPSVYLFLEEEKNGIFGN